MQNADARNMLSPTSFTIDRNEFTKWTEMTESTKIKLIKTQVVDFKFWL